MAGGKHARPSVNDIHREYADACIGADIAFTAGLITVAEKRLAESAAKAIRNAELIKRQREGTG